MNQEKTLILVDFQKEWIDQSSDYFIGDISRKIDKTNQLIDFCRKNNYKIIFIQHIEKDLKNEFSLNSKNIELIDNLDKEDHDIVVSKYKISAFYKTELEKYLEGINEIIVCGILTNLCVRSLIQDAYDRGFNLKVIKDCCISYDNVIQEFTFKDLKSTREEIEFLDLDEFIEKK